MDMADERGDEVAGALDALSDAIEHNSGDERLLLGRIHGLRRARSGGIGTTAALENEPTPGTMQLLGRILSRLMDASGTARRALAHSMRNEGTSIPAIARIFGVTHQRVSNILNRPPGASAPVLHEQDPASDADNAASGGREGVG